MAWTTSLVTPLRVLIGDMDSTEFTDARLQDILAVAASFVNTSRNPRAKNNRSFLLGILSPFVYDIASATNRTNNITYTIDINEPSISPDPTLSESLDQEFSNQIIILGAKLLGLGEQRLGALIANIEGQAGPALFGQKSN